MSSRSSEEEQPTEEPAEEETPSFPPTGARIEIPAPFLTIENNATSEE